jgi:hypothetical protein
MNEQQIIQRIRVSLDRAALEQDLQRVHQMMDHVNAVRSGEVQPTDSWVNSSSLLFPDDFGAEMNHLSSTTIMTGQMLEQLDRIEAALVARLEQV